MNKLKKEEQPNILEVQHLNKFFGHRHVVNDVSFQIKEGSFFALLGSNGAGKTTTLNIILTFLNADSGTVLFDGQELNSLKNIMNFKSKIGVVFQDSVLDQELTVLQNLEIVAGLYSMSHQKQKERVQQVIAQLNIDHHFLHQKVAHLSGGEKRKIDIARAIIHEPKILFLDELTAGLDPSAQNTVWKLVQQLNKVHQVTVIFTTHYLEESEQADQVVILHRGLVKENDTVLNLKNKYHLNYIAVTTPVNETMETIMKEAKIAFEYHQDGYRVYFHDETQLNFCLTKLNEFLKNFKIVNASMRDVFLHVVGEEIS